MYISVTAYPHDTYVSIMFNLDYSRLVSFMNRPIYNELNFAIYPLLNF